MQGYQPWLDKDVVYFNGQAINHSSYPRFGTGVRIDEIDGWEGASEIRDVRGANPGRDGERPDNAPRAGRTITIMGSVSGSTWTDLQARKRALSAIFEGPGQTEALLKVPDITSGVESSHYRYARSLNPIAYWRLGEQSGSVCYDENRNYNASYTNAPTLGTTGAIAGDEDTAATFAAASTQWASAPYTAALNPSTVTYAAWFKSSTTGTNKCVLGNLKSGGLKGGRIAVNTSNVATFSFGDGAANRSVTGTTNVCDGNWHLLVATHNGTTGTLYVDGVSEGTPSVNAFSANDAASFRIGLTVDGTSPMDGTLDECILFGSALTAAQIVQLYRRGKGLVGSNDTAGYERSTCRVLDSVQYGELDGPTTQYFSVSLRASDPRIYSDTTTSSSPNDGKASTKASVACTLVLSSNVPISTARCSTGGVLSVVASRMRDGDVVTFHTPDRLVDWKTDYYWGRLKLFAPIAYWRMDETSGTAADNVEGTAAYDGTYTGSPTLNQSGHAAALPSVLFNGSSQYVTVPFNAALNPRIFSVEFWIKPASVAGSKNIIGSYNANTGWVFGTGGSSGSLRLQWYDGSSYGLINTGASYITTATWYHVVVVFTAAGAMFYVNGQLVNGQSFASNGHPFSPVTATGALTWGRATDHSSTTYFNGNIDNVALYPRALTKDDVATLYAANLALPTFANLGGYVVEPLTTEWFELPVGAFAFQDYGFSSVVATYRKARL